MAEIIVIWDWLEFALRWLHVITAIAWIGSSFYFIALDLGLQKNAGLPSGVQGEDGKFMVEVFITFESIWLLQVQLQSI